MRRSDFVARCVFLGEVGTLSHCGAGTTLLVMMPYCSCGGFAACNVSVEAPICFCTNSASAWRIKYALLTPKRALIVCNAAAVEDSSRTLKTVSFVTPIILGLPRLFAMVRMYDNWLFDVNDKSLLTTLTESIDVAEYTVFRVSDFPLLRNSKIYVDK
jgi:hypothetical protein